MRRSASAPPPRSGCQRFASTRYAAETSSGVAPGASSSTAYGSIRRIVATAGVARRRECHHRARLPPHDAEPPCSPSLQLAPTASRESMSEQTEHPNEDPESSQPEHSGEPGAAESPPAATEPESVGSEAESPASEASPSPAETEPKPGAESAASDESSAP